MAIARCQEVGDDILHFYEFYDYDLCPTKSILHRRPLLGASVGVLAYYFFSAILFCGIFGDNSTCPYDSETGEFSYTSWATAIYFASTTISTVGYGDVTIVQEGTETWRTCISIVYMVFAVCVAVTAIAGLSNIVSAYAGLNDSREIASSWMRRLFEPLQKKTSQKDLTYQIRIILIIRLFELVYYFTIVNVFGMIIAKIIFAAGEWTNEEGVKIDTWSWMTTLYWAVQTTTTIGKYSALILRTTRPVYPYICLGKYSNAQLLKNLSRLW